MKKSYITIIIKFSLPFSLILLTTYTITTSASEIEKLTSRIEIPNSGIWVLQAEKLIYNQESAFITNLYSISLDKNQEEQNISPIRTNFTSPKVEITFITKQAVLHKPTATITREKYLLRGTKGKINMTDRKADIDDVKLSTKKVKISCKKAEIDMKNDITMLNGSVKAKIIFNSIESKKLS